MTNETYSYGKKGLFIWQKRPMHTLTYPESHRFNWLCLYVCMYMYVYIYTHMAKEAYTYEHTHKPGKPQVQLAPRGRICDRFLVCFSLLMMCVAVCASVKRGLQSAQKRPIHVTKETYSCGKRGL